MHNMGTNDCYYEFWYVLCTWLLEYFKIKWNTKCPFWILSKFLGVGCSEILVQLTSWGQIWFLYNSNLDAMEAWDCKTSQ